MGGLEKCPGRLREGSGGESQPGLGVFARASRGAV